MGSDRPKQYLPLGNRTIIEHTLGRLRTHARLSGVVVVTAPDDAYWPTITIPTAQVCCSWRTAVPNAATRAQWTAALARTCA